MIKIQITLFSTTGNYKPLGTLVNVEDIEEFKANKNKYYKRAIANICHNRHTSWKDLQKDGFTTIKWREYNQEKIEQQQKIDLIKRIAEERKNKKI